MGGSTMNARGRAANRQSESHLLQNAEEFTLTAHGLWLPVPPAALHHAPAAVTSAELPRLEVDHLVDHEVDVLLSGGRPSVRVRRALRRAFVQAVASAGAPPRCNAAANPAGAPPLRAGWQGDCTALDAACVARCDAASPLAEEAACCVVRECCEVGEAVQRLGSAG